MNIPGTCPLCGSPSNIVRGEKALELLETLVERYSQETCPFCGSPPGTTHRDPECIVRQAQELLRRIF